MRLGPSNNLSDVIHLFIETDIWLQAIVCAYAYPTVLRKVIHHWQGIVIFLARSKRAAVNVYKDRTACWPGFFVVNIQSVISAGIAV